MNKINYLLVYHTGIVTRRGRVETTNYRTVKLPTGMDLPVYIKNEFGEFVEVRREKFS